MQVAGGGSKNGWCRKMTVDGEDMQLACVVSAFFRQGCLLKLLHGDIDIYVAAAFYSGCMLSVPQKYIKGLVASLGMVVRFNRLGG